MVTRPSPDDGDNDVVMAFTTLASADEARKLVAGLVDARMVACGTIIPGAVSIYRWESKVSEEPEVLVILKTTGARWVELQEYVKKHHPYDVPELMGVPVDRGLPDYLKWVTNETLHRESYRK